MLKTTWLLQAQFCASNVLFVSEIQYTSIYGLVRINIFFIRTVLLTRNECNGLWVQTELYNQNKFLQGFHRLCDRNKKLMRMSVPLFTIKKNHSSFHKLDQISSRSESFTLLYSLVPSVTPPSVPLCLFVSPWVICTPLLPLVLRFIPLHPLWSHNWWKVSTANLIDLGCPLQPIKLLGYNNG